MNEMNTDLWIAQVLEAIEHGETPEAALAKVPAAARPEVQEAIEAALWLQNEARPALETAAARWQPRPPSAEALPPRAPSGQAARLWKAIAGRLAAAGAGLRPAAGIIALLLLIVFGWQTARAASAALPGEWAYPLKQAGEHLHYALTTDPADRLTLTLTFAHRRLEEAAAAIRQHRPSAAAEGLGRYAQTLASARRQWQALPPARREALHSAVAAALQQQARALQALALRPSPIAAARQQALQAQRAFRDMLGQTPPQTGRQSAPTSSPLPSPTVGASATPTLTPTPTPASTPPGQGNGPPPTEDCVSRGLGQGQNQCVPPDQGGGNDTNTNPAGSGTNPPGHGANPPGNGGANTSHGKP